MNVAAVLRNRPYARLIASALALEAELFVTSDQRQLVAAQGCGLRAMLV